MENLFEDVQFATPLWNLEGADFSDETRSESSHGSVKDEYMNGCYPSCHGSTCSSPYEDESDVHSSFDFADESVLALGGSSYQFGPFNASGESCTPQHSEPSVFNDSFLWCQNEEETLRSLELINMLSGFHQYQQPQNRFMDPIKPEVDSFGPSPMPPPFFSMGNRQDTRPIDEKNVELIANILKSQKPFKEEDKSFPDIMEVEKYIKREESSSDERATTTSSKKRPGASPSQQKGMRKKRKYIRRATARKSIQLYEFMLNLLDKKDESVTWVSREEGVFKLLKSKGVAQMWGKYKKNDNMTYESLSRALRHYYAQEILVPVPKKLHYRFCKKTLDNWYKKQVTC